MSEYIKRLMVLNPKYLILPVFLICAGLSTWAVVGLASSSSARAKPVDALGTVPPNLVEVESRDPLPSNRTAITVQWRNGEKLERLPSWGEEKSVDLVTFFDQLTLGMSEQSVAAFDLILVESEKGEKAWIPRYYVGRKRIKLQYSEKSGWHTRVIGGAKRGGRKHSGNENWLPVSEFSVNDIKRVVFTQYRTEFSPFVVAKRSDPLVMRGEKILLHSCLACHANGKKSAGPLHPEMAGLPWEKIFNQHEKIPGFSIKWEKVDRKSIEIYFGI